MRSAGRLEGQAPRLVDPDAGDRFEHEPLDRVHSALCGSRHCSSGRRTMVRLMTLSACVARPVPVPPPDAAFRTWARTTVTSIKSLGVHAKMSHSAARVSIDSRCGGWVTIRYT